MSGIMMQLLGTAGGGANYFMSVVDTPTDGDSRNTMHGVVDSSDNIYVDFDYVDSSTSYMGLIKIKPSGDVDTQRRLTNVSYRPSAASDIQQGSWPSIIDSSGNYGVIAQGSQGNTIPVFLKINPSNLTITSKYEKDFSTSGSSDEISGFWGSSGTDFYLCGRDTSGGRTQFAKFNSSGSQQWAKTINVTGVSGSSWGSLCGGCTDSSGNVYVCGTQPAFGYRGFIAKYNSSGTNQWTKWLNNGSFNNSFMIAKCDSSGNPYIVGNMGDNGGRKLAYVAKLNPSNGEVVWDYVHCKVSDPQSGGFQSIDFDSSDNVYLAGTVREDQYPSGTFSAYSNFAVYVKLNSSGTVQWQRGLSYSSARNNSGRSFSSIAIDSKDDMILTSAQSTGSTPTRFYIARLPNDGSLTGTYNTVDAKYGATALGDKNIGSIGNPSHGNSSTSTNNITSNIADGSNTYTISTQVI